MSGSRTLEHHSARLSSADCDLEDFIHLVQQHTDLADFPHAAEVVDNVLVYDADRLRADAGSPDGEERVAAELVRALTDGPGVVAVRGAFADISVVDRATACFEAIIDDEKEAGGPVGDHFAKAGANDRVWNALEKLAVRDPQTFVDYYANDIVALLSRAWLGPGYQVTSQVNVVRPGGQAQDPHRDYHLGFLENEVVERYPTHVHLLSPVLTLQGAVAHTDMPVQSGPTMYLPYSHQYVPGYLAWRLPQFRSYFLERYVQLPLAKGDAAFFNPALFHGAGTNVSPDIQRVANLLQVSSAFGRAMEMVDRERVVRAVYPYLLGLKAAGRTDAELDNALAAAAEGYPFPTNLDLDQPVGGLTPRSQAEIVKKALESGVPEDALLGPSAGPRPATVDGRLALRLLDDKVVLVSGGTQGVGAAVARAAVDAGATVAVSGRRRDVGQRLADELAQQGGREALFVAADVSDVAQALASVAEVVNRFGRIDGLVNAAGLTSRGTLLDTTPELFDQHVAVNLRAPFFVMQAAVQDMVGRGAPGAIVNIITMSAHGGQPYLAPYVATKAGLVGLTRNAAHAHRWDRIRINGINIGWTHTEGEDATQREFHGAQDGWLERAAAELPMGKLGQPDDAAALAVLLLSDRSGVVTGSIIDWDQEVMGAHD